MKKNPFKKQGIMDTLTNVGIGGAANVAIDYAVDNVEALASLDATTINAIKIGVGVLGGTMTTNKMIRAAVDGIATVGVSNLVKGLMNDTTSTSSDSTETTAGLPAGTIGRVKPGNPYYGARRVRPARVSGISGSDFMGK